MCKQMLFYRVTYPAHTYALIKLVIKTCEAFYLLSSTKFMPRKITLSLHFFLFILHYVHECFTCMYVCALHIPVGSPGPEVTDGCELPCGCLELNLGTLQEQPVVLTTKPSLQSLFLLALIYQFFLDVLL